MCAGVQDGQDKDARADSSKLVCRERKIEVNALQKHFCYFWGHNRNILQLCCDSQEFSLSFLLLPTLPKVRLKSHCLCAKAQRDVIKP